jgi:hypothetical protein
LIFGQQYFSFNPLKGIVDRENKKLVMMIGNAYKTQFNVIVIIVIVVASIILLILLVVYVIILSERKKRRLEAEEWVQINQKKLEDYARLVDSESSDRIRKIFNIKKEVGSEFKF